MPATIANPIQHRIFDSSVKFSIQASEIEEQFVIAASRRLKQIQDRLVSFADEMTFVSPLQTAQIITASLIQELRSLSVDVQSSMQEYGIAAGKALPRFLNRSMKRSEQLVESIDPFDAADLEEEEEEEDVFFLPLSDEQIRGILLILLWNGFTQQQQWELWLRRQQVEMYQKIAAGLAQRQIELADVVDPIEQLKRETGLIIKRNIAGGRGIKPSRSSVQGSATGLIRTQSVSTANTVIRSTLNRNRELIRGVQWSAILDSRVCLRCARLNGKTYKLREDGSVKGPEMPLHWLCRCLYIPVLSRRAGEQRFPRSPKTFIDWFKRQPVRFQKRLLGSGRYQLWKSGEIKFDDFVQFRRQVPVRIRTLDSLRKLANA